MTLQCTGSRTRRYFRQRPSPPPDATNQEQRRWRYEEGLCDDCGSWVPLEDRKQFARGTLTEEVLSPHEKREEPPT